MALPHSEHWAISLGKEKYHWDRAGNKSEGLQKNFASREMLQGNFL